MNLPKIEMQPCIFVDGCACMLTHSYDVLSERHCSSGQECLEFVRGLFKFHEDLVDISASNCREYA
jgi:hypothetical protein